MGLAFVLGGARSGKSSFAERLAGRQAKDRGLPVIYLATAQAFDDEMAQRIARHRSDRPPGWETVEVAQDAAAWLRDSHAPCVVLLDCLSLLLNNWLFLGHFDEAQCVAAMDDVGDALRRRSEPTVVVSNEVGQGIVPGDPLSRQYRDLLGIFNQRIAARADAVYHVVAGIAVDLRRLGEPL